MPLLSMKHYILFVANMETLAVTVYDSLGGEDNYHKCQQIISFLNYWRSKQGIINPFPMGNIIIADNFKQQDSYNCGIYLILTLGVLYEGSSEDRFRSQIDLLSYRENIRKAIIEGNVAILNDF